MTRLSTLRNRLQVSNVESTVDSDYITARSNALDSAQVTAIALASRIDSDQIGDISISKAITTSIVFS